MEVAKLYDSYFSFFDDSQKKMAASLVSVKYCIKLINTFKLDNILELGSGVSTLLFASNYNSFVSIDSDPKWAKKTESIINSICGEKFKVGLDFLTLKANQFDFIFYDYGNLEDRIYNFPRMLNLKAKYIYLDDFHIISYRYYVESKINDYNIVYLPETIDDYGRFGALLVRK